MGKRSISVFEAGKEIVLDDPHAVGGIGELQTQDFRVVLRLLQAVPGGSLVGFRFDDSESDVAC
jgi:hypothetical protein